MKKTDLFLLWFFINLSYICFIILGFILDFVYIKNIISFYIWVNFIFTLICFLTTEARAKLKEWGSPAPDFLRYFIDFIIISLLAGLGHFVLASISLIKAFLDFGIYNDIK